MQAAAQIYRFIAKKKNVCVCGSHYCGTGFQVVAILCCVAGGVPWSSKGVPVATIVCCVAGGVPWASKGVPVVAILPHNACQEARCQGQARAHGPSGQGGRSPTGGAGGEAGTRPASGWILNQTFRVDQCARLLCFMWHSTRFRRMLLDYMIHSILLCLTIYYLKFKFHYYHTKEWKCRTILIYTYYRIRALKKICLPHWHSYAECVLLIGWGWMIFLLLKSILFFIHWISFYFSYFL